MKIEVWADVFHPVVHVDVNASQPVRVTASYENWRQTDLDLPNSPARPRFACLGWDGYPGKVTRFQDEVKHLGDTVFFLHRNRDDKLLFDYTVRQQGLEQVKDQLVNTQKGRTFGGILRGQGICRRRHGGGHLRDHPVQSLEPEIEASREKPPAGTRQPYRADRYPRAMAAGADGGSR